MKDHPANAKFMTTVLARAYRYTEIGDYGTDPDEVITMQDAEAVITSATQFLAWVEAALN
jgi:HEPN domain-containing protein